MTIMYDSVDPMKIPLGAAAVAGYKDGLYAWTVQGWNRFPNAAKLTIAVSPKTQAAILDIENGDATPADAPGWCDRFNVLGRLRPSLYCSLSAWDNVKAAVGKRPVDYWIADQTGLAHCPTGAVACQFIDAGPYDLSLVVEDNWLFPEIFVYTPDMKRAMIHEWYYRYLLRECNENELEGWLSVWNTQSEEAVVAGIYDSAEAQKVVAAQRKLLGL